jgi:hypothetical protein
LGVMLRPLSIAAELIGRVGLNEVAAGMLRRLARLK